MIILVRHLKGLLHLWSTGSESESSLLHLLYLRFSGSVLFFVFFLRSTIHLYRIQRRKSSIVPSTHWVRMWTRGNLLPASLLCHPVSRRKLSIVPSMQWMRMWTRGNLLPVPLLCHPVSIPFLGLLFTLLHSSCQWLDHLTEKNWMLGFLVMKMKKC